jgi:hypothetical protein
LRTDIGRIIIARGDCDEAGWIQETQAGPTDTSHEPPGLEHAKDATGHLPARPDEDRQVRPRQHRSFDEEQIAVLEEDAGDPPKGILVERPIQAADHVLERREHLVEDVNGEARIRPREGSDVIPAPHGGRARRERESVCARRPCHEWEDRDDLASPDDADDQLSAVDGRATKGNVTIQDQRKRRLIALVEDRPAGPEDMDGSGGGERPADILTTVRKRLADHVRQHRNPG